MLRIRAQFVHPVTAPPIEDGAVLVDDRGTIAAVGPNLVVPTRPGTRQLEFPDARLLPGLVNTHTHLELTHLAGKNAEREFAGWIRTLRALKDATTPEEFSRSAEQGVRDAWAAGVTCVADTGSTGASLGALARLGGRGIYYQEVFGPDPAQCAASMAELEHALARLSPLASSPLSLGVSPHAPYTVSEPLYRAVADLARRERWPLAMHLAESRAETELVRDGSGALAEATAAGLDGEDALRMLTIEGARALGLELEIGSLEVGKQADLAVFPSTILHRPPPPSTALLTLVAGRVVHG